MVAREDENQAAIVDEALTRFVNVYVQGEKPNISKNIRLVPCAATSAWIRPPSLRASHGLKSVPAPVTKAEIENSTPSSWSDVP